MITSTFTPSASGPTDTLTPQDCASFGDGVFATGSEQPTLVAIDAKLFSRDTTTGALDAIEPTDIAPGTLFHRLQGELDITLRT